MPLTQFNCCLNQYHLDLGTILQGEQGACDVKYRGRENHLIKILLNSTFVLLLAFLSTYFIVKVCECVQLLLALNQFRSA